MLRTSLLWASDNTALQERITTTPFTRRLALRFVAGETLEDGLRAARGLAAQGRAVTLDYLGESVRDPAEARAAAAVITEALARIAAEGLPAGVSVKPTQMGLGLAGDTDGALCRELLDGIAATAGRIGTHVTLDMEGSDVTEDTVRLVEDLQAAGHRNVGCALQSYLHRTPDDVRRLSAAGASLRLCKGTYDEPGFIAYTDRRQVDIAYDECAAWLLAHGIYPRLATHDHRLIMRAREHARRLGVTPDAFEFQMLYGVRASLQDQLVRDGYRLCVYVPFGGQWYPYLMRRLAERPANLLFFLRALRDT